MIHYKAKKDIAWVELPDDAKRKEFGTFCKDEDVKCKLVTLSGKLFLNIYQETLASGAKYPHGGIIYNVPIPNGFTHIVKASEVTEEIARELVEVYDVMDSGKPFEWVNYETLKGTNTALLSLRSLENKLGVVAVNPLGKEMPDYQVFLEHQLGELEQKQWEWLQAQKQVRNYYIIY